MKAREQKLFDKAEKGDGSILNNPLASKIKDSNGSTPLHYLAVYSEEKEIQEKILNHEDASKIKNNYGYTPYDYLPDNIVKNKINNNNNQVEIKKEIKTIKKDYSPEKDYSPLKRKFSLEDED